MLNFLGPDGEALALYEMCNAPLPAAHSFIDCRYAVRGFHLVEIMVAAGPKKGILVSFMGHRLIALEGNIQGYKTFYKQTASIIDVKFVGANKSSVENAGSVHHIAFSVSDASQGKIRQKLIERGYNVTGIKDRSYFKAVYFHTEECLFLRLPPIRPGSLLMSLSKKGKKFMPA